VFERTVLPLMRRIDFRGKGRLRQVLPLRSSGAAEVTLPGGPRLQLDLRESVQRDYLAGQYDRDELDLVIDYLEGYGDFVDVGAHVGLYTVAAARVTSGRVLALEPNPTARAQLEANVALNELENVLVRPVAVAAEPGTAQLHVPATPDPSFSSLEPGRFAEGDPVEVEVSTVDAEVEAAGLEPMVVKIDVEGTELDVVAGMEKTLEAKPALLVEVSESTAQHLAGRLPGYDGFRIGRGKLEPLTTGRGTFNAWFLPRS
jgi:FkbM family methyltransferase